MRAPDFAGILPAYPTPTTPEGAVDEGALRKLLRFLLGAGVHGLVPVGGTGEYTALSRAERTRCVAISVEEAAAHSPRVPVVAGILSPGFAEAVEAGRDFAAAGADALLLITPFYVTPTQAGIADYFRAYRQAVDLPILYYDVPTRTRIVVAPETLAALAADGTIIGMKACNTDIDHFNRTARLVGEDFALLSGEDTLYPAHLALGAKGGILATAALLPHFWLRLHAAGIQGDIAAAVREQRRLIPFFDAIFAECNPGPLKEAMAMAGLKCGSALPPLRAPGPDLRQKLAGVVADLRTQGVLVDA